MRRACILLLTLCIVLTGCAGQKKGTAELRFRSFDGGGPQFTAEVEDPGLVRVEKSFRYDKRNHKKLDGAGYDVIFTFAGLKPGQTRLTLAERAAVGGNRDRLYTVAVGEDLQVTLTELSVVDLDRAAEATATLVIETDKRTFYATLADNDAAVAFRDRLSEGPLTLELQEYGGFEKVGELPWTLEPRDETITTVPGDVILYQGDKITIYYDESTWSFTRLGRIENVTREDLLAALGEGCVTVSFYLEWSE